MSESLEHTSPSESVKSTRKVRSAWIAFVGRIVAQVIGAVASVTLGLFVLQQYQWNASQTPATAEPAAAAVARAGAERTDGTVALAVLPLDDFSPGARDEIFADGMTEAVIADLAQIDGLRVISRTSSMRYKAAPQSLPEIARQLDVDMIVEGSLVRAGDRVRVTAQLIDARTDEHVWARTYDQIERDLLTLQAGIASTIARDVADALTSRRHQHLAFRGSIAPVVLDSSRR